MVGSIHLVQCASDCRKVAASSVINVPFLKGTSTTSTLLAVDPVSCRRFGEPRVGDGPEHRLGDLLGRLISCRW